MSKIVKVYKLSNGLNVYIYDETVRYFCNYFNVILKLSAPINISISIFDDIEQYKEVKKLLGEKVEYFRMIKKNAVVEDMLNSIKEEMLKDFEENSLPYLAKNSFIKKFILRRLKEKKKELEIERLRKELSEREDSSTF
jgi:oligoribonuclease NrnB/cAMP/cGMP phosphodiesterase (DHH superfamily)